METIAQQIPVKRQPKPTVAIPTDTLRIAAGGPIGRLDGLAINLNVDPIRLTDLPPNQSNAALARPRLWILKPLAPSS